MFLYIFFLHDVSDILDKEADTANQPLHLQGEILCKNTFVNIPASSIMLAFIKALFILQSSATYVCVF